MLSAEQQAALAVRYLRLNPVKLRAEIEVELERLWELRERSGEAKETKDGLAGRTKQCPPQGGKIG